MKKYNVAGYVKLAKLWEKNKNQALEYHRKYYAEKYAGNTEKNLYDVYIDITGQKQIYKRPEMLRLLQDCSEGKIDCIAAQTKAYLAANSQEFCYLLQFLQEINPQTEFITEDVNYHIDTIVNEEHQKEALLKMAEDYVNLDKQSYEKWKKKVQQGMTEQCAKERQEESESTNGN